MAAQDTVTAHVVDFTNTRDGGGTFNKKRVAEGDYAAKVTKVQDSPAKDGTHQWLFTIELQKESGKYPYYCKLQENQLWKLRNLCLAAGIQVPKKKVKVDPNKLVNKLIAVTMEDDEYEGKRQSVIAAVFPVSELSDTASDDDEDTDEDEDDEEEEPTPPPAKKKAAAKKPAPVVEDDEDDEDEEDDEEDEEEEPEPTPPPKKKVAKKAVASKKKPAVTEDDLEELDLDDI